MKILTFRHIQPLNSAAETKGWKLKTFVFGQKFRPLVYHWCLVGCFDQIMKNELMKYIRHWAQMYLISYLVNLEIHNPYFHNVSPLETSSKTHFNTNCSNGGEGAIHYMLPRSPRPPLLVEIPYPEVVECSICESLSGDILGKWLHHAWFLHAQNGPKEKRIIRISSKGISKCDSDL